MDYTPTGGVDQQRVVSEDGRTFMVIVGGRPVYVGIVVNVPPQ